jgi:hypothetical protein
MDPAASGLRSAELFPAAPAAVAEACRAAMTDLSMREISTTDNGSDPAVVRAGGNTKTTPLRLTGKTADGRDVRVELRPMGLGTVAAIKVGRHGDVPYARTLLERLGVRLGTLPPQPIPDPPSSTPAPLSNPFLSRGAVPDAEMFRDQAGSTYRDTPAPF